MATMNWSETDTRTIVQAVTDADDLVIGACAVIGAMVGILAHFEGDDFARQMLNEIVAMKFRPDAANSNQQREGNGQ
ncbi:hypothetical protein [Sinorhizobium medicae]|uniref:hypothetical protein n=1 Tax=Sinorhizobium medicae TaxID=110321 RepID=UPI000C7DAE10|nr:hypothetical protein [Sinorhizobium medicae]MDX0517709.1 hypothetical protein [Sinorhizobium medicae]MDX0566659.1 hypothetical protein [Sinorhizobium medicae]MDX0579284.1 hypothetical protein [Sinorhizobium medicae]MDX0728219.1 hypothetical protein [Sinorhizobium medicae]MDX0734399.1 hypothetical protein [Sinorhizobium medicae]